MKYMQSDETHHSRNDNSKIKMNEEPRPIYWDGTITMLPTLTDKALKSVKSKDYAIALLINAINSLLDEYKFYLSYFNNRFYIYQDNYWNEISLDKVELFLRDCTKKYYQNEIKYHTESFYKPLGESFKKEMKVLVEGNKSSVLLNCKNLTLEFNQKEFKPREARKEDYLT